MDAQTYQECQVIISVAEACHRGSYSWHVLQWLCVKQRRRLPLVAKWDLILNMDAVT